MLSDIEIAQSTPTRLIVEVAAELGITAAGLELFGSDKAKIRLETLARFARGPDGKLILVTAMTPTPAGEGKTTTTVGLGDALRQVGKRTVIAIREPSLGPCFGIKGGAAGGGYAQVVPMEDINLHFTGDLHAVTSAHNLLAAMVDNHIHSGNPLGLDMRQVAWRRVIDMNDRTLRHVVIGLGGPGDGVARQGGFDITAASEVMAVLCLASGLEDLKARLGRMVAGRTGQLKVITAADLKASGAMAALLKHAIKPNLVQTLEGTPAFVHGGPFGNIAHGCSSLIATRIGLQVAEYVVTEAGFGSDLGAEKFFNITCRLGGLSPACAVVVATVRALKYHGGKDASTLAEPDPAAVAQGLPNLEAHVGNIRRFGVPVVVAVNRFTQDRPEEIQIVLAACREWGVPGVLSTVWAEGGKGGHALAEAVLQAVEAPSAFQVLYPSGTSLAEKVETICTRVYGADGVDFSQRAREKFQRYEDEGRGDYLVCMAKTQYSLSDDKGLLGRPRGFRVKVRDARLAAGAGFVVVYAGDIMTMPGLPRRPAAEAIDIDGSGRISGLF